MAGLAYTRRGLQHKEKSMAGIEPVEPGHDDWIDQCRQMIWPSTSGMRPRTRSRSNRPRRQRRIRRIRTRGTRSRDRIRGSRSRRRTCHSHNPWLVVFRYVPHLRLPCRIHRMSPD
jgi:hypothetical protein